jgi:hypothetical protein
MFFRVAVVSGSVIDALDSVIWGEREAKRGDKLARMIQTQEQHQSKSHKTINIESNPRNKIADRLLIWVGIAFTSVVSLLLATVIAL